MENILDVLAFGPHPDDVELTCAGTLITLGDLGYRTGVISITRGEMSTRGNLEKRQREFDAAAKIMGLRMHKMLDVTDTHITVSMENKLKIIQELRTWRPRIILVPYWHDRHPDHINCSHLVREAAFYAGVKKIATDQEHFRPAGVIYFPGLYDFTPSFIVDITPAQERKLAAIRAYGSQFYNPNETGETDVTFISTPEYFDNLIAKSRYWGAKIGVKYAEPFLVRTPIAVKDPVALFGPPDMAKNP